MRDKIREQIRRGGGRYKYSLEAEALGYASVNSVVVLSTRPRICGGFGVSPWAAPYSVRYCTASEGITPVRGQGTHGRDPGTAPIPLAMSPATPGQQQQRRGVHQSISCALGGPGLALCRLWRPERSQPLRLEASRLEPQPRAIRRSGSRTQHRAQLGMASVAVAVRSDDRQNGCQVARGRRGSQPPPRQCASSCPMQVCESLSVCAPGLGKKTDGGPGMTPGACASIWP